MKLSPTKIAQIVALREAGWSLSAIANHETIGISTVQRALLTIPTKKGVALANMVDAARKDLTANFVDAAGLARLYTELVCDTVAQISLAREKAGQLLERVDPNNAALGMRALAAHSVAIKNHTDTLRHLLPAPEASDEIPVLEIVEMTAEDVQAVREQQEAEKDLWGDGDTR